MARFLLIWIFRPLTERSKGNLRLIAGCFCLSSIIWIFNSLNKEIKAQYTVPIKIKFNENAYIPLKKAPLKVKAIISGHGWHIASTMYLRRTTPLVIWFKYPGTHSRIDTSILKAHLESNLGGIKVEKILLDSFDLPFDSRAHKWVHMQVDEWSVNISKDHERDQNITVSPDSILVTGPKNELAALDDTLKIKIPYQGLTKDFEESFKLSYFLNNPLLQTNHEKVRVKFNVWKKRSGNVRK